MCRETVPQGMGTSYFPDTRLPLCVRNKNVNAPFAVLATILTLQTKTPLDYTVGNIAAV